MRGTIAKHIRKSARRYVSHNPDLHESDVKWVNRNMKRQYKQDRKRRMALQDVRRRGYTE